jgi:spore cortex formation protein SpoVR/YcgB (stage V sporulation)
MSKLIYTDKEWTSSTIEAIYEECKIIAEEELKMSYYTNQIEIVDSSKMLDVYASIGMPIMYNHWSFGKHYLQEASSYKKGFSNLALELVINSNPCISYLMDENTMTQQALVIAHACFGHNNFFKENWLFQQWTDPSGIIDYLVFAKKYISECEEKYGVETVERTLDACHALQNYGVHKYVKPVKLSVEMEKIKQKERNDYIQKSLNVLWSTIPKNESNISSEETKKFPEQPEENILFFLEQYSPKLEGWQREIIRIVRHISQYFYPQRQTKIMNEGWATFTHYYIMNRLYDKGLVNDGHMMEFIHCHSSVVSQQSFDSKHYRGINPYALGLDIFRDIKRICEEPTEEDREWFPEIYGLPWLSVVTGAVKSFRDESFILQFLSPNLIRKWKMFVIEDDRDNPEYSVTNIHDESGYKSIRRALSRQHNLIYNDPDIQISNVDLLGNRTLNLKHTMYRDTNIDERSAKKVLEFINYLWGYKVCMESVDSEGNLIGKSIVVEGN